MSLPFQQPNPCSPVAVNLAPPPASSMANHHNTSSNRHSTTEGAMVLSALES